MYCRGRIDGESFHSTCARDARLPAGRRPPPAQAQPQASPDTELVTKIRQAISDDKAIAQYAQTVKIAASDGLVTLKGSVKSDADKKAIGAKADQIAGEKNVMNNLFVSTASAPAPSTP